VIKTWHWPGVDAQKAVMDIFLTTPLGNVELAFTFADLFVISLNNNSARNHC
jgi:hypothetical protein